MRESEREREREVTKVRRWMNVWMDRYTYKVILVERI
jgi:hypothetical protein